MDKVVTNPKTGKKIIVGGKTYNDLLKTQHRDKLLKSKAIPKMSPKKPKATSKPKAKSKSPKKPKAKSPKKSKSSKARPGCSNQGKYPNVPKDLFCGPSGGACPGTYPVNNPGRAISALSYARHAPNPDGIRECAMRIAKSKGWIDPKTGKIQRRK